MAPRGQSTKSEHAMDTPRCEDPRREDPRIDEPRSDEPRSDEPMSRLERREGLTVGVHS